MSREPRGPPSDNGILMEEDKQDSRSSLSTNPNSNNNDPDKESEKGPGIEHDQKEDDEDLIYILTGIPADMLEYLGDEAENDPTILPKVAAYIAYSTQ